MQKSWWYLVLFALALFWLVFVRRANRSGGGGGSEYAGDTGLVHGSNAHVVIQQQQQQQQQQTKPMVGITEITQNGIQPGSHVWSLNAKEHGLPSIFPPRDESAPTTTVCVFERNPRQRSFFSTNMVYLFGTGKYKFQAMTATDCQHFGTCASAEESNAHPLCPPGSPTVGLVEWVKCCFHDRFTSALTSPKQNWDVAVSTGDEYCAATEGGRAHFRFYYRENTPDSIYLPLGPREEFIRVKPQNVAPATTRKYLFNFVGSLTSTSRKVLSIALKRRTNVNKRGFVHIVEEWNKVVSHSTGYLLPYEYRLVLMNSTFTLCPDGHNPESYRIYEALEAGSIPVLVLDRSYQRHACKNAFHPLLEAGAPFVFLDSWSSLAKYLESVRAEDLPQMQANAMSWYSEWMQRKALAFEKVLDERYRARVPPAAE